MTTNSRDHRGTKPDERRDQAHRRDVLIALNADGKLSRSAICRLATGLDKWLDTQAGCAPVAASLGLETTVVERARRLADRAEDAARQEQRECDRLSAHILTLIDPSFPARVLELPQPPPILYYRGRISQNPAVAVVGARRADGYGLEAAAIFSRSLASSGLSVISGFARGIDITAHRSALAVDGGETVAVLGCGLDVNYPAQHARDRDRIAERGALVSEFPCTEPPRRRNFPVRNRLIAALSAGTLVIQAAERSGSLITARHALELGREVFAIPGPLFEEGWRGSNRLLRDGALLVESAADIVAALPLRVRSVLPDPRRPDPARRRAPGELPRGLPGQILAHLRPGRPRQAEELATLCGAPIGTTLAALLRLELTGLARRHPGGTYSRMPCGVGSGDAKVPRHADRASGINPTKSDVCRQSWQKT